MPRQLPLPFAFHGNQNFDCFIDGPNRQIVESLKAMATRDHGESFLFLHGGAGLGKSHLLLATCDAAARHGARTFYLPLHEMRQKSPIILDGLEENTLVCIDDIDRIAGDAEWERALFHLFNRLRERSHRLVVGNRLSPQHFAIQLPDLISRLRWGLTLELKELGDADKIAALQLKARLHGLDLPLEVGQFLLSHYPRDLPSLWKMLETLDYASLSEQRKLTIPFLKSRLPG